MRKAIVLTAAVLAILYALYIILVSVKDWFSIISLDARAIGVFIIILTVPLLIMLTSISVIFKIRPANPLRTILVIIASLLGLINIAALGFAVFMGVTMGLSAPWGIVVFAGNCLGMVATIITCLTCIIRTLKPAENKSSASS